MEEETLTVTEVVKQGSQAPDWLEVGTTLEVVRTFNSGITKPFKKLVVQPTDGFGQATASFDSKGRLTFGGTGTYIKHRVEVE